ncbi:hypothetical protein LCGC14_0948540 [marine sediment metagenome]|uniref:Uncharacterized protein n=1 Tax=marine sediment metagenome TaxID=412755 RepID=A0A0F9RPE4_9ZZZZ
MSLLKWTKVMDEAKERLKHARNNNKDYVDNIKLAVSKGGNTIEQAGHFFLFNIPICVAGSNTPLNSYEIVGDDGEEKLKKAIKEKGYRLIAWYGWGGCGWLAQVRKINSKP